MKKLFIAGMVLAALALAGWFGGIGFARIHADMRYRIPDAVILPEKVKAGERIPVSLEVTFPRSDSITAVTVTPGQGSVADQVSISRRTHYLTVTERMSFTLLPLRSGKLPAGEIALNFKRGDRATVTLPEFEASPATPAAGQEIQLAGAYQEPPIWWWAWGIAAIVWLFAAGVAVRLWRRRRKRREKSFYEHILAEIATVRHDSVTPERGIARLTDLVREYLDFRFHCAVESASTWEFLRRLEQKNSPLPAEFHPFLREFLRYADTVKFARAGADWEKLADAAERAAMLVRSTMPQEKEARRV